MDATRWPTRRRRSTGSLPPPPRTGSLEAQTPPTTDSVPPPLPRRRRDAVAALLVDATVLTLLIAYLFWLLARWPPEAIPARILYAAIGVGTMFTIILFVLSLIGYVLPRLLGLRRVPGEAGKA